MILPQDVTWLILGTRKFLLNPPDVDVANLAMIMVGSLPPAKELGYLVRIDWPTDQLIDLSIG